MAFIAEYRKETNTDMSLEVNGISKQYGNFTALHPLSFTLSEPGVYALLGTNGAGKTTCFNLLTKFLEPTSGVIRFNDVRSFRVRIEWRLLNVGTTDVGITPSAPHTTTSTEGYTQWA